MEEQKGNDLDIRIQLAFDSSHNEKEKVLADIANWIAEQLAIKEPSTIVDGIKEREALGTTGFGDGFAIPHGKIPALSHPVLAVIRLTNPIDWDAMDDEKVSHLMMILVPEEEANTTHLTLLSTLAYHLMDNETKDSLKTIQKVPEMRTFINRLIEKGK